MRGQPTPDHAIAALAGGQGGVVARRQLLALGLSPDAVERRIRAGRLHPIHRGVYSVGHRVLGPTGRWWAAILACAPGAALSHVSAAAAWDLRRSAAGRIDVTVAGRERIRRRGIRVHRPRRIEPDETTTCAGIPITTPTRTILDLAATGLCGRPLEAVLDRAEVRGILDFAEAARLLERYPRRAGSPALRAVLSSYVPGRMFTRSELEERFLELCDRFGLARPCVNVVALGNEIDFRWPGAGLIVEVDGYAWHRSPSAMADDRERDVRRVLAGYRVLRFTWGQVTRRPKYVATSVRRALGVT